VVVVWSLVSLVFSLESLGLIWKKIDALLHLVALLMVELKVRRWKVIYIFFPGKPKRRGLPKLNHYTTFLSVLPYHSLFSSGMNSKREKIYGGGTPSIQRIASLHKNSSISKRSVQLNMESKVGSHFLRCISGKSYVWGLVQQADFLRPCLDTSFCSHSSRYNAAAYYYVFRYFCSSSKVASHLLPWSPSFFFYFPLSSFFNSSKLNFHYISSRKSGKGNHDE